MTNQQKWKKLSGLLEPGDLVVSGGTNVWCFYAGDVYGERRSKLLSVNPEGFVGEWSVGTHPYSWPYILGKMPGPISVVRPLNEATIKVAERRRFPRWRMQRPSAPFRQPPRAA